MKLGRQLILYCTPTKPGHSRIFYIMLAERKNLSNLQYIVATATAKWMKFVTHFIQNDTLDGDNFFLHIQVWTALVDYVAYMHTNHWYVPQPLVCTVCAFLLQAACKWQQLAMLPHQGAVSSYKQKSGFLSTFLHSMLRVDH